jgi:hypothetical protein
MCRQNDCAVELQRDIHGCSCGEFHKHHLEHIQSREPIFDYCACVRLIRLDIISIEVYCHVYCRVSRLLHPLRG